MIRLTISTLFLILTVHAQAALSGTKAIGPSGDYASITAALSDIHTQGLGGPLVLELQASYVSTVETFPITFTNLGTTVTNSLTVRPQADATNLTIISADTTAATVDLNGAQFVTLDGRPAGVGSNTSSGVGTASQLSIANTSASGVAMRFINEASNNTLEYVTVSGANTSTTSGVVVFSTTTGANGNDNNTLDHCDVRDGVSPPANTVYSLGTQTTDAQNNSNNNITNCNLYNFFGNSVSAGAQLGLGNSDWTFSGNSFYQTASHSSTPTNWWGIAVISGSNYTVTNNFLGGSAPYASGTPWPLNNTSTTNFTGIRISANSQSVNNVQGNTICNFAGTGVGNGSIAAPGLWCGIYIKSGAANIGTLSGNTIGSDRSNNSISYTTSSVAATVFGIASSTTAQVAIANNKVGSISVSGSSTDTSAFITGIYALNGSGSITNNLVGSNVAFNSLNAPTASTSTNGQQVIGILATTGSPLTISGNTVSYLNNAYIGTAPNGQIIGISLTGGTITGNTVHFLYTRSLNPGIGAGSSACGILLQPSGGASSISQNLVHSISNSSGGSTAVSVKGIYCGGSNSSAAIVASRNLVHSISLASSNATSQLIGMDCSAGTLTVQNNMVQVGITDVGTSTATASIVRGIYAGGGAIGPAQFYHNSVYVGGTQTSGAANTFAFDEGTVPGRSSGSVYQNNIFVNARSNNGGTGKHYAATYARPTAASATNNLFFVSGIGGVLGLYNGVDQTTLINWQTATGKDANSLYADPLYVHPIGPSSLVNLHLRGHTPAEGAGILVVSVVDDFDGQTRSALTPVDIGADAENFALDITYTPLRNGSTDNLALEDFANITGVNGVSGGANAPRLYFKRSTDADVFGGNSAADDGWKYVVASNGSSPYSFTIDYSLLYGGSVALGDMIQYFVVAQDDTGLFRSNPLGAGFSASPAVQTISSKPSSGVNNYTIMPTLSGTVTVGTGGDYPSLSGSGGLFYSLNQFVLTGDLTVKLVSDTVETGNFALNPLSEVGTGNHSLTIQPADGTMKTLSGTPPVFLIELNGTQRVIIDGSYNGSGRFLTFRCVGGLSCIDFVNGASKNTVRNCVIEGAVGGYGVSFDLGRDSGNNNNLITGNVIRDRTDASGMPLVGIYSAGTAASIPNSGNILSNNEILNFTAEGIHCGRSSADQLDGQNWTITGNNIYQTTLRSTALLGIDFGGGGTNVISGNSIHQLNTTSTAVGIVLQKTYKNTTVSQNRIYAFPSSSGNTLEIDGINFNGGDANSNVTIVNNMVSLAPTFTTAQNIYGIRDLAQAGSTALIAYNTVLLGGTGSSTAGTWAFHHYGPSTCTLKNNLLLNLRTGGGKHYAAGGATGTGSLSSDYNVFSGTGSPAANFFDSSNGTFSSGTPISYAQWKSNFGGDIHSSAGNPGGNFSSAMFTDPANGDLHLVAVGNPLANGAATPLASVTTDFDGDERSSTTPFIGADELPQPEIVVEQPSGTGLVDGASSVDYGSVPTDGTAIIKIFTIRNLGTASLTGLSFTVDGANAADFGLSPTSSTPLAPNAAGFINVTFLPGATGQRSATLHIVSNDFDEPSFDIALTGTGVISNAAYQQWAQTNGVSGDPSAPGSDGLKNLINFGFAINPGSASTGPLVFNGNFGSGGTLSATGMPITRQEGTDLRALFVRRKDYATVGLTYTVQFSAGLSSWQDSTDTPTVLADDGTNQIVSVPYPAGLTASGFFRISVTLP